MGSDHSKKQSSHEDFLLPLKQRGIIDQQTYDMGKLLVKNLQNRQYQQVQQYFQRKSAKAEPSPVNPPVCRRIIKKDQMCYQCKTCQYMHGQYLCGDCFQKELHVDHDFHAIDGKMAKCECGNDQILDEKFFCKRHSKVVVILAPEDLQLQKQTKFLVQLLIFIKRDPRTSQTFKISQESNDKFGQMLLNYLIATTKGPRSQVAVAQALLDKMDILTTSPLKLQTSGNSILQQLLLVFCEIKTISSMIAELINQIYRASSISKETLRIFYRAVLLGNTTHLIPNYFLQIKHAFLRCYKSHLQHFNDRSNARIFLNRGYQATELENEYLTFYNAVSKILDFKHPTKIIANIMSETPFSKLFNYQFQGPSFVEPTNKLTLPAFYLAKRIIKAIEDKEILKAIAVNTLEAISKKNSPTFDLIFERSFALTLYQLYDYRIPNRAELLTFFSQIKKTPQQLILMFWQAKDKSLDIYNKLIVSNQKGENCPCVTILATDQLYMRILCSMITTKEEVSALYDGFIIDRVHHASQPLKGIEQIKQQITSTGILKSRLHQLTTFITLFGGSLNSDMCELIVRSCQGSDKDAVQRVLSYLSLIFQGSNATEFKASAQRFASSHEVATFIKERLVLEGKKIHFKGEIKSTVSLFPFSEYFPGGLSQLSLERMTVINMQLSKEHHNLFVEEECLRHLMILLYACLLYIEENQAVQSEVQEELESLLKSVLAFSGEKRSKEFLALVQRIYGRIANCPPVLDNITKKILQVSGKEGAQEEGENARNNKKKQKMQELKSKQKNLLEAFQVQDQKRVAECIVCKNSKAGNPYLLGHFGYKNIFSKVLKAEKPFLEFSSCGHFIHEECLLQESHKNQFKVWYPCILCKAISNILLPSVSTSENQNEEELYKRILIFLKNLGGLYTFFYQDRKELVEFGLEKVEDVFPLLFKTLVYQITFYPILNLQYFQRSQLPVTRLLYDLLQYTSHKLIGATIARKEQIKGDPFFVEVYNYVFEQLSSALKNQGHRGDAGKLPTDVIVMVEEIIYMLSHHDLKMEITPKPTKEYRDKVVSIFLRPPHDLKELQGRSQQCVSCQKVVENYEMCLLCDWACCSKCNEVKKVHTLEAHLSESVFLRNANGKYTYVHEELLGEFHSLYVDYLGEEYSKTERATAGEYLLSREKWEGVLEDLLSNRIHREVMKFQ